MSPTSCRHRIHTFLPESLGIPNGGTRWRSGEPDRGADICSRQSPAGRGRLGAALSLAGLLPFPSRGLDDVTAFAGLEHRLASTLSWLCKRSTTRSSHCVGGTRQAVGPDQ